MDNVLIDNMWIWRANCDGDSNNYSNYNKKTSEWCVKHNMVNTANNLLIITVGFMVMEQTGLLNISKPAIVALSNKKRNFT